MTKPQIHKEQMDFLTERAIRFFNIYGDELESISQVLKIRLASLASAYTVKNKLPCKAINVQSRVKSLTSFLRKLEKLNWPMFGHPTEVITDLIGARVVCWFVDDCYGMLDYIQSTKQFLIKPRSLEDFIKDPKPTGYRAIHLLADVSYDRLNSDRNRIAIVDEQMICEIQIRSKLQNAWSDFTHEMYIKVPSEFQEDYQTAIVDIANNLAIEDSSALTVKNILQRLAVQPEPDDFNPSSET